MDGVWWLLCFSFSYLYDHSVGDKEVGGEDSMMIELCVMFNHGLSEDDVTVASADRMLSEHQCACMHGLTNLLVQ